MKAIENEEKDDNTVMPEVPPDHSLPLRGIVICCTSVPDEKRTALSAYAKQMGALHQLDLTRDVTHLIIGAVDTPKYRYVAKNRQDIMPMAEEWIEAIRNLWIADKEIDFESLEQQYMLPTFYSLRFSMTGCDEPAERLKIAELVKANGATYEGDLTKSITHLISLRTEGAKYKAAKSWGLKIVSIEWLHQSLERGMILDEKLFDPALPPEERGRKSWNRTSELKTSLGRRPRTDTITTDEGRKRKLRKTANTKLSRQHDRIWADISGGNEALQVHRSGVWQPTDDDDDDKSPQSEQLVSKQSEPVYQAMPPGYKNLTSKKLGMFAGCKFWLHEFSVSKMEILQHHLESNGAQVLQKTGDMVVVPSLEPEESCLLKLLLIVPHDLPKRKLPVLPESTPTIEIVTFWWVERCLHHKRFLEPKDHVIGRPFTVFPIPDIGAKKTVICSSAFTGIDLLHLTRAVELIGATYSDFMTRNATLLVTKSIDAVRKDKLNHAIEWKIPIVSAEWLWDSIEAGTYLSIAKYTCQTANRNNSLPFERGDSVNAADFQSELLSKVPSKSASKANSISSSAHLPLRLDRDAFLPEIIPLRQDVPKFVNPELPKEATPVSCQPDPLAEREVISPSRSISVGLPPSEQSFSRSSEVITNAISSLLAKTKNTTINTSLESTEPRKRSRILGRVTSNTSNQSCATSVDSTATHGHPVQWPSVSLDHTANERIDMLMKGNQTSMANTDETQPSNTQLEYEDLDSEVARELVMARMRGEVINFEKVRKLERKVTIGDFDPPKSTVLRNRKRNDNSQ